MKQLLLLSLLTCGASMLSAAPTRLTPRQNVPIDSIIMSDPCILADEATNMYYMTGTGGRLWTSSDLKLWNGPYSVTETDSTSWMGSKPQIWAAELHKIGDKYYYFATFTNNKINIKDINGNLQPRRASHILVSDSAAGPYKPVSTSNYCPTNRPTLDGTFWQEPDGKMYMVFCGEWISNDNGTVEAQELAPDLSTAIGEPRLLFRASDSPWSNEIVNGKLQFNRVTDGPWLFRTGTGRLGMIWTSWHDGDYTTGVAYSESGKLEGPWVQEANPILPPNNGHGMMFKDFDGRWLLSAHSHSVEPGTGRYIRRPVLWAIDLSGDKLVVGKPVSK